MAYQRLPLEQYFVDTANDPKRCGTPTCPPDYRSIRYPCGGKLSHLLGMHHDVNYAIGYVPERDVIQIHFQKTCGMTDWFANFEFEANYYDAIEFEGKPLQLRVHRGWAEMYLAAKRVVRAGWQALHEAHPTAETEILGWSLGSGQAMLCAQDLNYNFGLRSRVYTFGSVKPFRARPDEVEPLARYLSGVCASCANVADVNDIVTYMPPFRGYTAIRRVSVQTQKKRFWRLMNPYHYHVHYYNPALYRDLKE